MIERLRLRWWEEQSQCHAADPNEASTASLTMHNMAGVFIVLSGGTALALIIVTVEWRLTWAVKQLKKTVSEKRIRRLRGCRTTSQFTDILICVLV